MAPPGKRIALFAIVMFAAALGPAAGKRKQPPPLLPAVVQALNPSGLRISVLDEEGMDLVIINANVNEPIEPKETGQISETLFESQGGFWTIEVPSRQLKQKDVIFYWIYASSKNGRRTFVGHYIISELVNPNCRPSITTVNGRPACKGDIIVEDNFDTLNTTAWINRVHLPARINNAFASYVDDRENSFAKDGTLHIKATLIKDESELNEPVHVEGCSLEGDLCEHETFAWNIPPPARTVLLKSTTSFRFGRVEVRAKPAVGDWIYSRVYMSSLKEDYGKGPFESGEIGVMRVRGNPDLRDDRGTAYGANVNHVHIGINTCNKVQFDQLDKYMSKGLYSDEFHTYAVTWTPREIKYEFDGDVFKTIAPPVPDGFLGLDAYRPCDHSNWEKGTFMAPFDVEFYLKFLLEVGGFHIFPDGSKSGENTKPWRDFTPRAALQFWRSRDKWFPTWKDDYLIDYIKVTAL